VSLENANSEPFETSCRLTRGHVAAADFELVVEQYLGDAAHAGTTDADEVNAREIGELSEH
jgi:hypothetical protein